MNVDFGDVIKQIILENPDLDMYKLFANTALERFLLFINDEIAFIEYHKSDLNNKAIQKLTWNYLKICYKEAAKHDKSIYKKQLKGFKKLLLTPTTTFENVLKSLIDILIITL